MTIGKVTTYDLTVGVKLDIEDTIWLVSPIDVPLLGGQGADGRTVLSSDTCFEKKVEWLDDSILTPRSTIATATVTTGTTSIAITTAQTNSFGVGDLVLLENNEVVRVTALSTDGVTLTPSGTSMVRVMVTRFMPPSS